MMLGMKLHLFTWVFFAVQRDISAFLWLTGIQNNPLNFTCSHTWATANIKYFCRRLCRDKDVLIRSEGLGKTAQKGRYSLHDGGGQFTVSINRLMKLDQGQYWCGVERSGIDTYEEVTITVLEAQKTTTFPNSVKARHNYIPACMCGLLIILVLSLVLYYNQVTSCHALTGCLSACTPHTPRRYTRNAKVNVISSEYQTPSARIPVYVNVQPSVTQTDSSYETLHIKAIRVDPAYDTLVCGNNQSDRWLRKKTDRFSAKELCVSNENKPVEACAHLDKI